MSKRMWIEFGLGVVLLGLSALSVAEDSAPSDNAGFLEDYSELKPSPDTSLTKYYLAPQASEKLKTYSSIMVDSPQVFISADSPYKGFKPAHMNVVTEAFRAAVISELKDDYTVVDQAGQGVLMLRLALVNIEIDKDRTHILGYTPAGLAFRAVDAAASSDYQNAVRHTSLVKLSIEGEVRDSKSGELFGEFVDDFGSQSTPGGWKEFQQEMKRFGEVTDCQLKNAQAAAADRVNCRAADAAK